MACILVYIISGCSSKEAGQSKGNNEIAFWVPFSGPDGPHMKKIVDEFNKSQNEYKIKYEIKPNEDYYKTVDLAFNSKKNLPDLFVMHGDQIPAYADMNVIKPLDDLKGDLVKKEDYNPTAWEGATYKDKLFGVPLDIHPLILYWNKDMFKEAGLNPDQPPKNREEFLDMAKKLTQKDKGQFGFVVPTGGLQKFMFPTIVYQNGGDLITNNKINYTSKPVVEALQFERDLIEKYKVAPTDVQDSPTPLFLQKKAAMILNGPWMINQFKDSGMNFATAPVPMLGTEQEAVFGSSHNFVLPTSLEDENKIKGIKSFLKFVADNGISWANAGQAPASKEVYESEAFKKLEHQANAAKQFDVVKYAPEVPNWGQISNPLYEEVNLVLLGQKDAKKAMEDAQKESQQKMDE